MREHLGVGEVEPPRTKRQLARGDALRHGWVRPQVVDLLEDMRLRQAIHGIEAGIEPQLPPEPHPRRLDVRQPPVQVRRAGRPVPE